MRRTVTFLLVLLAAMTAPSAAQAPATPPFSTKGARELLLAAPGDTLLPEFSYLPADLSYKLVGSRLVVVSPGIPLIFLRIYKVSRYADGSIKLKQMLSADTVYVRVGNTCAAPWISLNGNCVGDTTRVPPVVKDTTKNPPVATTIVAPPTTAVNYRQSAARSVFSFASFVQQQPTPKKPKTFQEMLATDSVLRETYKKHPEIAPRRKDLPVGTDNQLNPVTIATPMPTAAERRLPLVVAQDRRVVRSEKVIPVVKR
jgi:hypothetical protein